ncbi:hypothetical protein F4X73_13825 [Candidatus Poribacteria bacterium]|nr:hypothetical protein [Candidatus Poribacteria bacterium]
MTADKMSPSELAKCRENLRRHWETRKVDKELVQRAWTDAQRVAAVLYQKYGASKVAVFGSLAEQERFCKYSDIDIVVWGVSYNRCLNALWETEGLSDEFEIDIIDVSSIHKLYRERILNQAIPIERGEIDPIRIIKETDKKKKSDKEGIDIVNQEKLIQRIFIEREKIGKTVKRIGRALEKIEILPIDAREFIEIALAADLAEVYTGIEKIFQRIAKEIDKHTPSGSRWHNRLLTQMAEHKPERPQVVTEIMQNKLKSLLDFRHRVNSIYGDELIYATVEEHAKLVSEIFQSFSEELETFINFLNKI